MSTGEQARLQETKDGAADWHAWGPYLSERAWGTVREDYSADGNAWNYLPHDMARSQGVPLGRGRHRRDLRPLPAPVLRAGALERARPDPEGARCSALNPNEGNHGEDVKEYYFYVDSTPTHSLHEVLYKYPQAAFPYQRLIDENQRRAAAAARSTSCSTPASSTRTATSTSSSSTPRPAPDDICIRIEAYNRGPDDGAAAPAAAPVVPQHWAWGEQRRPRAGDLTRRRDRGLRRRWSPTTRDADRLTNLPFEYRLGRRRLYGEPDGEARCSPTTRPNVRARSTAPRRRRAAAARQGRVPPPRRRRRAGDATPAGARHQGVRCTTRST